MTEYLKNIHAARKAQQQLYRAGNDRRRMLLESLASDLLKDRKAIIHANNRDLEENDILSEALKDRLRLTDERLEGAVDAMRLVAQQSSPVDLLLDTWKNDAGLSIEQVSVPLGVVGIIYEARPNVTIDATALCLQSSNALVLRGSASAKHTNHALVRCMQDTLIRNGFSRNLIVLLPGESRQEVEAMLSMKRELDVLLPRGGKELIDYVVSHAQVPVIETGAGVCHVYVDESADVRMATSIALNAKTQRPSVCNAAETILIHASWGTERIQSFIQTFIDAGVEVRGCPHVCKLFPEATACHEDDWHTEYLAPIISIRIIASMEEAIEHIADYGTKHSEAIIASDEETVSDFFQSVDAAVLYHNASTRFTDGGEFGFGAEMGISTQKLHVRGPIALRHLVSYQYRIRGEGQIRS